MSSSRLQVWADRWLIPLASIVALVGFFGAWVPHKAVALLVTGFELSEFAKFFPEVQTGAVPVVRSLFLLPFASTALIIGLWANAYAGRTATRVLLTALAVLIALPALPQYESLRAPDYRGQLLLALGGAGLVALTPLTRRWSARTRLGLASLISAAGILGPVTQYVLLRPLIEAIYNRPISLGWGLIVCVLGYGTAFMWAICRAAGAGRETVRAEPQQPDQHRKVENVGDRKEIVFYGTAWCPDCLMARRVLDGKGVAYTLIDIDKDPAAAAYVQEVNRGFRSVPTIVFPDGSILVEPSRSQLNEKIAAIA